MSAKTRVDFLYPIRQIDPTDSVNRYSKMGSLTNREQFESMTQSDRSCLILNSRQSKRPCGVDAWVTATDAAIRKYSTLQYLFLTSIGMNSWELTLHLVNIHGGRQIITIPPDMNEYGFDSSGDLLREFRLAPERTYLHVLTEPDCSKTVPWSRLRDEFLTEKAQLLVPVSVRPLGRLESLLSSAKHEIDSSFRVQYLKPVDRVRYDWNQIRLNPHLDELGTFLTHWTRSVFGPPASMDHFDFYDSVQRSGDYPFSARHILERILTEQLVRASSRFIRRGYRVVSFTALNPSDAVKLMRWRRRYGYYSFEPYGIAVESSIAANLGCRPVLYRTIEDFKALQESDRPFFQNIGSESADWQPEAEWRCVGDFDLGEIPVESLRVITYRESEIDRLQEKCECEVIPLTIGD